MQQLLDGMARQFDIEWFDYQLEAIEGTRLVDSASLRTCLYFRTGAGKTYTSLAIMRVHNMQDVLVIAPPRTHEQWRKQGHKIGINVTAISHQLYRQKGRKFSRLKPVIVDEFHMLGGQGGTGWGKLRLHARGMQAPLILLSATPNYNDVERVYCVHHILDPLATNGGYEAWIYRNCETEPNPFAKLPKILGFADGRSAAEHLAELPHVYYLEDPHVDFPITEIVLPTCIPHELEEYGLDLRSERIVASRMEYDSASRKAQLIDGDGLLDEGIYETLSVAAGEATTPTLVFCARAQIAAAGATRARASGARVGLVTGAQTRRQADATLAAFKAGELDVLFGTASMSTGVDGLDKVCDLLILLDDTDDESLRRQVIGRILPRGADSDVTKKMVVRMKLGNY